MVGTGIFRSLSARLFGVCSTPSNAPTAVIETPEKSDRKGLMHSATTSSSTAVSKDTDLYDRLVLSPVRRYRKTVASLADELGGSDNLVEIVTGRFYMGFTRSRTGKVLKTPGITVFTVDDCVLYEPFHQDFGPLNLGVVHRYALYMAYHMSPKPENDESIMVHLVSSDQKQKSNAAFLAGSFCIVMLKWSLERVLDTWLGTMLPTLLPYRDAAYGPCTFKLSVADCLDGLAKGCSLGWYDFRSFDLSTYEKYDRLENGDLHWIIPNEFIAFSGPEDTPAGPPFHVVSLSTAEYAELFNKMDVKLVIRLNKEQYDRRIFLSKGINHEDLYFLDGSCPPPDILTRFLHLAENHPKPIAVHCKAGLGRTGTLLGCYAMKNYGFTARQWIGWNRITRPGSVLGPQQQFLCDMENKLRQDDDGETPASLLVSFESMFNGSSTLLIHRNATVICF